MCKCVSVSEQEMQQLVLFSKMLRNAVSKVQCAGCFVHCVFPVVFVCVCVSRRMSCNSFFVFNETKDESPRWYRFNVNIPCIQTARVVPVFGRLRCKPVDVAYCQFNTLISYAQEAYLRVIPIQSKLLGSLESVLRRLRSISERRVCTCVCVCVWVSKHEMQQLGFVQQSTEECSLQSRVRWVYRALCFVCVSTRMRYNIFFFATTPRIEPNVNTGLRTTRGLMWTSRLCRPRRSYKYSDASV